MKEYNPTLAYIDVDCPCLCSEFSVCNITNDKCPVIVDTDDGDIQIEFPKYCPAKEGIIVKIKGD